jgi:hypothetical protein
MPTVKVYVYVGAVLVILAGVAVLLFQGALFEEEEVPTPDPAQAAWEDFAAMVAEAKGIAGPEWTDVVQRAAAGLWPGTGADDLEAQARRKLHSDLSNIAGDVARDRAHFAAGDPSSVEIHDAFVAAVARGRAAYAEWVAGEGAALLRRRIDALSEPPR